MYHSPGTVSSPVMMSVKPLLKCPLNPVWVGRFREDAIQQNGKTRRIYRSVILGPVSRLTEKQARRAFEPFLARVNSIDYQPERFGKIGEFSETWECEVPQHQKPSSIKAAQSCLHTYVRPLLADVRLEDFAVRAQQNFVTRLSQKVSRKTTMNVLSVLRSILRTAKSWGYCCHALNLAELALPVAEEKEESRFFTAEQVRQILAVSPELFRTMFAIAAMTGLRAGEVVALQRYDLDLERGLLHVRRSAWYGRIQSVKTKARRAPVAIPQALEEILREHLANWKPNPEGFLFSQPQGAAAFGKPSRGIRALARARCTENPARRDARVPPLSRKLARRRGSEC